MRKWMLLLAIFCWGCSGAREARVTGSGPGIVSGGAVFRYEAPNAKQVHLVGDFNNWSPTADPMTDTEGDGVWVLFYPLEPGTYQYKFVVDGKRWIPDPSNPLSVSDGFDGRNSIVKVPVGGGRPSAEQSP